MDVYGLSLKEHGLVLKRVTLIYTLLLKYWQITLIYTLLLKYWQITLIYTLLFKYWQITLISTLLLKYWQLLSVIRETILLERFVLS